MGLIDRSASRLLIVAGAATLLVGIIVLIVGVVTLNKQTCENVEKDAQSSINNACRLSSEAKRTGLVDFIKKVQRSYYSLNPNNLVYDPDVVLDDRIKEFSPYDCKPSSIKKRTDKARELLQEIKDKNVKKTELKPREDKALQQVLHYLANNFGQPYQENYYAGDWMMGPNSFCWMPICSVGSDLRIHFKVGSFQPKTYDDVKMIIARLNQHEASINQYLANVKYGVKAGMVRAKEDCEAGMYAFRRKFQSITQNGPTGILHSDYTKSMLSQQYLSKLDSGARNKWVKDYGRTVNESIMAALITSIGKPVDNLLNYLENTYVKVHCVPSSVSAGLANLPLDYVYYNGKPNLSEPTTKKLPTGEALSGPKAYEAILPYFTTNDMTPDYIYDLGWKMVRVLYPQAVEIAKVLQNETDATLAIQGFKKALVADDQWFNDPINIPQNESNDYAFKNCVDLKSAEMHCPVRYKGMMKWISYVQGILSKLHYRTTHMFYHTGPKVTAPNCPLKIIPKFLPGSGSQSFRSSAPNCKTPAYYLLPFFLEKLGPVHNAYSVAAHEGRPGHHTQVQGNQEHFADKCGGPIDWLNSETYYTAFTEGWALYSENPLMAQETDIYKDNMLQKYGMLKWQLWRALRLIVDTGMHYKGMNRTEALRLFEEYAWDNTDKAIKDITRYQSNPGQATAYMIGQLAIWQIRNETEAALGADFDEKEFHYQALSQGSSPLSFLKDHMAKYSKCVKNKKADGCQFISGLNDDSTAKAAQEVSSHNRVFKEQHFHEHYD